jgi:hypothetical protein
LIVARETAPRSHHHLVGTVAGASPEMHCPTFARSLRVGRVLVSQLVWKFGATPPALFADFSGADVIPVSSAFYSRIALAWSKYV